MYGAHHARQLGIRGWIRNTPNGSVELICVGDEQILRTLRRRLHDGPPLSRVDAVDWQVITDPQIVAEYATGMHSFEVRA